MPDLLHLRYTDNINDKVCQMMHISESVERQKFMDLRTGNDRRKANPFGAHGPWLATGKMGGLIITERRMTLDRRTADRQPA